MTICRILIVLSMIALMVAGCGTAAGGSGETWAYTGPDARFRSFDISRERYREIENLRDRKSGAVPPVLQRRIQDEMATWRTLREAAIRDAKAICARETGTSATAGFWTSYSDAFMRCMAAKGWSPAGSNPL